MGVKARITLCVGLAVASVGVGYLVWGAILMSGVDANIGAGIAILLGAVLLAVGVAITAITLAVANRGRRNGRGRRVPGQP